MCSSKLSATQFLGSKRIFLFSLLSRVKIANGVKRFSPLPVGGAKQRARSPSPYLTRLKTVRQSVGACAGFFAIDVIR